MHCAYTTGRELAREWRVVWIPGIQNFLVNIGARKGGLCFQWAGELLNRLDALRLQTLDLHWAESYAGTSAEHNVIVVTARDNLLRRGILLDNWRYGGHLVYVRVGMDPLVQMDGRIRAELAWRLKANSTSFSANELLFTTQKPQTLRERRRRHNRYTPNAATPSTRSTVDASATMLWMGLVRT